MSVLGLIGAGVGLASTLYGAHKGAKSAKEQEAELARQRAANEAWYNRNYYQDYLNTVEAQNALKLYKNAWAERTKEARARQAITGGTPEQAQAVAEAGGEAMGNMVGNLAAKGQQDKAAIDAQKLAMDNNLSAQAMQIAENRQTAASNLVSNSANMITSGLQAYGGANGKEAAQKVANATTQAIATDSMLQLGEKTPLGVVDTPVPEFKSVQSGLVTPVNTKYKPWEK